jgi:hypothetical protein
MKSKFLYGLPEKLFDLAILWRPVTSKGLVRRIGGSFPSWSWLGWIGAVTYEKNYGIGVTERRPVSENESPEERIRPYIKYYTYDDGGTLSALNGSGIGIAEAAIKKKSLPLNWTQLHAPATLEKPELGIAAYIRSKVLAFWTWSACLFVEQSFDLSVEGCILIDETDTCVGELFIDEGNAAYFGNSSLSSSFKRKRCDLIVISEGQFFF